MDRFLIRKRKLSDGLPGPDTRARSADVKESPGPSSYQFNVAYNIDVRSKNRFRQYHESY